MGSLAISRTPGARTGLFVIAAIFLAAILLPAVPTAAASVVTATVVQTIHTSAWLPPSPDPSGITFWPQRNHLVLVDGEVEEMAIWAGANVFQATLTGSLVQTYDTTGFNVEPVGIDIEIAANGHWYISNDSKKTIFDIDLGLDGTFGTADDVLRSFLTSGWGNTDPEGLTLGGGKLYTVDGAGARVFVTEAGSNGIFDATDATTSFSVAGIGISDPEGIDYDSATGNLWVVDRSRKRLNEITTSGTLLQSFDLKALAGAVNPADVTLAPGSNNAAEQHLYVVDRGVDNNVDPNENDGKIYEIALSTSEPPPPPPPSGNLLANPSFEDDANGDAKPDVWSSNKKFSRGAASVPIDGPFVGRFAAADDSSGNSFQKVAATAGTTYTLACSANIPTQNNPSFSLKLQVRWLNGSNSAISTWKVATLSAPTSGWAPVMASSTAPSGTVNAEIRLVVSSLNGTIDVDQCSFSS